MEKSLLLDFTKIDPENAPSTGLIIPTSPMSELRGFCVRYYVESLKNQQILTTVSYDLNLLMYFENEVGFVAIKGGWSIFPIPIQIKPYTYNHLCYSHNMTHYHVAAEGRIWFTGPLSDDLKSKLMNPVFDNEIVIGPDISSGEDFPYFRGKLSELNILSEYLSETDLIDVTSNCDHFKIGKKILDWADLTPNDVKIPEGTEIKTEMRETIRICRKRQKVLITLMPFPSRMKTANDACLSFGGELLAPYESQEYSSILKLEEERLGQYKNLNDIYRKQCKRRIWVPIIKSDNLIEMLDYNNRSNVVAPSAEELVPKGWTGENDGLHLQMCYLVENRKKYLADKDCSQTRSCISCLWKKRPRFKVRGFCAKANTLETYYTFVHNFHYDGFIGKSIKKLLY